MDHWTVPPTQYGKVPARADLDAVFLRDISDVRSAWRCTLGWLRVLP
jgi:hypothetical protein